MENKPIFSGVSGSYLDYKPWPHYSLFKPFSSSSYTQPPFVSYNQPLNKKKKIHKAFILLEGP